MVCPTFGRDPVEKTTSEVEEFQVEKLKIQVHPSREAAGAAAAKATSEAMKEIGANRKIFSVIFATGASQMETLKALTAIPGVPWPQIDGFHMDDYVGLPLNHPASFRAYLEEKLVRRVPIRSFAYVDGLAPDPAKTCADYAEMLRAADPQLCLIGIGENGHLAFNDPAEANFNDPLDVKIVHLDEPCRRQQAAEGWFKGFEEVPPTAITLTMPRLFRVPKLIISVLGPRKANVIRRTFDESISTACPSTILRTHPDATVFMDREAAANVTSRFVTR
jgi:glucosamine-6-phosphate deaminase